MSNTINKILLKGFLHYGTPEFRFSLINNDKCNYEIIDNFDIDKLWNDSNLNINPHVRGHNVWLDKISQFQDFDECFDKLKHLFTNNVDKGCRWLERYHKLYYSMKKKGYVKELVTDGSEYISCLKFPDNTYYRLDGTHRVSILKYLGYKHVTVQMYDFEEIIQKNSKFRNLYQEYQKNYDVNNIL